VQGLSFPSSLSNSPRHVVQFAKSDKVDESRKNYELLKRLRSKGKADTNLLIKKKLKEEE